MISTLPIQPTRKTTMHKNALLLKRFYERDRDALWDNLHPEYQNHTPGSSQLAGSYAGKEGMLAHIQQMQTLTNGTFRAHHQGVFIADDEWGLVPVTLRAERNGKKLEMLAFGVWRFKDGLFIDHWENPWDLKTFEEFWA